MQGLCTKKPCIFQVLFGGNVLSAKAWLLLCLAQPALTNSFISAKQIIYNTYNYATLIFTKQFIYNTIFISLLLIVLSERATHWWVGWTNQPPVVTLFSLDMHQTLFFFNEQSTLKEILLHLFLCIYLFLCSTVVLRRHNISFHCMSTRSKMTIKLNLTSLIVILKIILIVFF